MDIQIGEISHYYDKLCVAVIEVAAQKLKVGDIIRISGHDKEFTQEVESLQVEHDKVQEVSPGESAGLKVDEPVKAGDRVFLVTSK